MGSAGAFAACAAHAPTHCLGPGRVWAAGIAPVGASAKQPQDSSPSNLGKTFLVQPLRTFHGSLTHVIELNGK